MLQSAFKGPPVFPTQNIECNIGPLLNAISAPRAIVGAFLSYFRAFGGVFGDYFWAILTAFEGFLEGQGIGNVR